MRLFFLQTIVSAVIFVSCAMVEVASAELSAGDWVEAAQTRLQSAISHKQKAAHLLSGADDLKGKEYLYDSERIANFLKAGKLEVEAGDLLVAASEIYIKASENWLHAAKASDAEKFDKDFSALAKNSRTGAAAALEAAVKAYKAAESSLDQDAGQDSHLSLKAAKSARKASRKALELENS